MTNKDAIKYLQQIYPNGGHCWLDEQRIEAIDMAVKALQEEPVSNSDWLTELQEKLDNATPEQLEELWNKYNGVDEEEPVSENLNTESMIESYKQRLISQANGMKNSPLIDMCLASYKHGIKETLDILNLSNVQRTVKNWKEHTSEDLEEASREWLIPQLDKSYAAYGETKQMELTHFDGYAMLDAIEFGAQWQKEQMMAKAIDAKLLEGHLIRQKGVTHPLHAGDKVKVIVLKEE